MKQRRAILEARGIKAFDGISKTSTEHIMRIITDGVKKNRRLSDITRSIVESPVTGIESFDRANKIARTEVLTAVSIGKGAVMDDAEKKIPGMKKAWIHLDDGRVRKSHIANQAKGAIGVKETYEGGMRYPRDVNGPAEERIRCRCDLIMIPPDDLADLEISEE